MGVTNAQGTTQYTYNALGQRVASTADGQTTQYLIDPAGLGNVVSTYNGAGSLVAHFNYGLSLVSQTTAAGASYFYDFDTTGSTAGLSDSTGSYVNSYRYLPFGQSQSIQRHRRQSIPIRRRIGRANGQPNLLFMRARFYCSVDRDGSSAAIRFNCSAAIQTSIAMLRISRCSSSIRQGLDADSRTPCCTIAHRTPCVDGRFGCQHLGALPIGGSLAQTTSAWLGMTFTIAYCYESCRRSECKLPRGAETQHVVLDIAIAYGDLRYCSTCPIPGPASISCTSTNSDSAGRFTELLARDRHFADSCILQDNNIVRVATAVDPNENSAPASATRLCRRRLHASLSRSISRTIRQPPRRPSRS